MKKTIIRLPTSYPIGRIDQTMRYDRSFVHKNTRYSLWNSSLGVKGNELQSGIRTHWLYNHDTNQWDKLDRGKTKPFLSNLTRDEQNAFNLQQETKKDVDWLNAKNLLCNLI